MADPTTGAVTYPYKKYNFRVEIDGIDVAGFTEVSGFDASIDVIEYREGTEPVNAPRKCSGLTKYGNVTLKWGLTDDTSFYEWVAGMSGGGGGEAGAGAVRKDVIIILLDDNGTQTASWTLANAWPCKYTAPDFNASASEIAFESVEMAFDQMTRDEAG